MLKLTAFVLIVMVIEQARSTHLRFNPQDLQDDVRAILEELERTVQDGIDEAQKSIDSSVAEIQYVLDESISNGINAIQEEDQVIKDELDNIKYLVGLIHENVDVCLEGDEAILNNLWQVSTENVEKCRAGVDGQIAAVSDNVKFNTDALINEVEAAKSRIDTCRGDEFCLSTVASELRLAQAILPQRIENIVQQAKTLFGTVETSLQQCTDTEVTLFTNAGNALLDKIKQCINDIISS